MLCRHPFAKGEMLFPCGQCLPCRFNKRRVWAHRMMLEAACHSDNCFVTLTYDDEHLPLMDSGQATLVPADLSGFVKRMRTQIDPVKIRFFGVGEYGDETERPHYHLAIFGWPVCERGRSVFNRDGWCCANCAVVAGAWGKGRVLVGDLSVFSSQYVAGYVVKKWTKETAVGLNGRHPEFSRMSLRPGIGADFMHDVASTLMEFGLDNLEDVPAALRHGGKEMPLGRYLRRRLRRLIGRDEKTPEVVLEKMAAEVRSMFEASRNDPLKRQEFARLSVEASSQRFLQFEAKRKLYKKERKL